MMYEAEDAGHVREWDKLRRYAQEKNWKSRAARGWSLLGGVQNNCEEKRDLVHLVFEEVQRARVRVGMG